MAMCTTNLKTTAFNKNGYVYDEPGIFLLIIAKFLMIGADW